jgi:hypothetical protein
VVGVLTGLVDWIAGRPAGTAYNRAFVEEVRVARPPERNPRVEKFILICWVLIAVKHVAVIWAVHRYHMPFHQLLVNAPTWLFGVLATWFYYRRPE